MIEILAENLVPGDIVSLNEGDGIPADIRLIDLCHPGYCHYTFCGPFGDA